MKYIIVCVVVVTALSVAISLGNAGQLAKESKLKRDLDAQLPVESRYKFPAVNKEWLKTTRYIDPVLLDKYDAEKVSEEQKKRFEKEEVFSVSGKPEGDHRVLTYDPAGKLRSILDRRGNEDFIQNTYADGAISNFIHRSKGKLREAYSVSPDGSEVCRVSLGSGTLKGYSDKPSDFSWRQAFHEGDLYFRGEYTEKKLSVVWLVTDKDELGRWRNGSEMFSIDKRRASWVRDLKGEVRLTRLDGEFNLKKVDPERMKLWEGKYAERISVFYDRYDALLKKAGSSWAKLEIEFVRKGKPFPDD